MSGAERKERKEEMLDMQIQLEVDIEDLYTLKVNCKEKRTVGKANKEIYVEQAHGEGKKAYKKRSQSWAGGFFSLRVFWVSPPSHLEDIVSSAF